MASLFSRMKIRYGKFMALVSLFTLLSFPLAAAAQNLGKAPATGQAVQGQQATQVEGAVLNVRQLDMQRYLPGDRRRLLCRRRVQVSGQSAIHEQHCGWRHLLAVSAVTRLIEYFIAQGQQVGGSLHQLPIFTNHPVVALLQHLSRNA